MFLLSIHMLCTCVFYTIVLNICREMPAIFFITIEIIITHSLAQVSLIYAV